MLKRTLILGAALVAFATGAAMAADVPAKGPVYRAAPAPVFNWTGFYVGVHGAGAWGNSDFAGIVSTDLGGYAYGIQGGYNWQFAPSWILGVDVSWAKADINGGINIGGGLLTANHNLDQMLEVGGKLGFLLTERTQLYVGAAYVWADASATVSILGFSDTASAQHKGWSYRVGLEHYWTPYLSSFLEYRGYDLDSANYAFNGIGATVNGNIGDLNQVRVGLNYKFTLF